MGFSLSQVYNEAFQNASLQNEVCYQEFRKVLELLRGDGVEYVWYDMLCINQADEDKENGEKAKEIPNMASYYHYNKGCYVLLHGVGQGYTLWNEPPRSMVGASTNWKGSRPSIPRWFTRVWTFQEYVLPSRLIFIVEGLDRSTKSHLNYFIRRFAHDPNLLMMCSCVATNSRHIDVYNYKMQLRDMANPQQRHLQATQEEEEEVIGACDHTRSCHTCGIVEPLIRKVKDQKNLYFVNGKAYLLLVDLDWGESALHQREFFHTLMQLHLLAEDFSYHVGRIALILQEIRKRKCTNEEDRVLSILGLLQVGGEKQVRTGRQLEDQLLKLPKNLHSEILVQLCSASEGGGFYEAEGLSWAPSLALLYSKESLFDIPTYPWVKFISDPNVVIKALQPDGGGRLKFKGKVVKGRIVPLPRSHIICHKHLPISCYFCGLSRDHPYSSLDLHQIAQCNLELGNKVRLLLDVHFFFGNTTSSQALHKTYLSKKLTRGLVDVGNQWFHSMRQEDVEDEDDEVIDAYNCSFTLNLPETLCIHNLPSFDVWVLHVRRTQTLDLNLLLCLGNIGIDARCELHKIGTLSISQHLWDMALNSNEDAMKECILGGFGKHTIHKLWEAIVKPPYTCYQCNKKVQSLLLKV